MRNEYPRPDFERKGFTSLDEEWDFDFDDTNVGHQDRWFEKHNFSKTINVPFCFESKLSGIQDVSFHDYCWYHKTLKNLKLSKDEALVLHFEGIDYHSEVYFNGAFAGEHYGANCGFKVDVTPFVKEGDNEITIYVYDPCQDRSIPRGKQDWELNSHGIWYTRTSGIYKPVWMEIINKKHINNFYLTTRLDKYQVSCDLEASVKEGKIEFVVNDHAFDKKFIFEVNEEKHTYVFNLPNDFVNERVWSIEKPFLFDLTINLYDIEGKIVDTVKSYLGIREVTTKDGYVLLNGKPIYQKLVLNQGYYPDGILTAGSIDDYEKDIDAMIAMGFNGCRIHQKTADPYFLYLCDKKGFLIWQECAANYGFNNYSQRRMVNEWIDIVKTNYNHPSIIAYTPFNESWGIEGVPFNKEIQSFVLSMYYLIHSLDSSRLVISNDGWEHCKSDLLTVHNYCHGQKGDMKTYESFIKALSTRENIERFDNIQRYIINPGFEDENQPIILSEFGGVAFVKDTNTKAWGYTTCKDGKEYQSELERIYKAIEESNCITGICYTQLTDVEQEVNGLMTYDRKVKVDPKIIKSINDALTINER